MRLEAFGLISVIVVLAAWLMLVVMVAPDPHEPARLEPVRTYGPWEKPSLHAYQIRR
jgi:hypothetical protein